MAGQAGIEAAQMKWNPVKPLTLPPAGTLLMDCTEEQRDMVEEDKRRWTEARRLLLRCEHSRIRKKLDEMPEPLQEDMRRRLNIVYENMQKGGAR